jgi:protein-S-isoprenylcysteine O-methyltransferase Ste14
VPRLALAFYAAFIAVAVFGRMALQYRLTGDHGLRGFSSRPGSIAWLGGFLFGVGMVLALWAPLASLDERCARMRTAASSIGQFLDPWRAAETPAVHGIGAGLALVGLGITVTGQLQMKHSWRVGVRESETTALVRAGLFALVRNPIYTGILLLVAGLVGMVPNAIAAAAFGSTLLGVEIQVRRVEEPYLVRVHGETYLSYARAVGRFLPGIGRGVSVG